MRLCHYCFCYVLLSFILISGCGERFSRYPIPFDEASYEDLQGIELFLEKQIKNDPNNVAAGIEKLKLEQKAGWKKDSENLVQTLLKTDSASAVIRELAADYYLNRNMISTSLRHANMAEELGANSASFYQLKAILFSRLDKYDEAIDYTNKAILINRSDYNSYYTKGKIYLALKDTASALRFMEISLKQDRSNTDLLYQICNLYQQRGQYATALNLINEAIELDQANEQLNIKKAGILQDMKDFMAAKRILWTSFYEDVAHTKSGLTLGKLFYDRSNYDSAIVLSNLLTQRDSTFIDAILLRARAYDRKYFLNNAASNYEMLLSIDSTHQEAQEEMQKVKGKIAYLRRLREARESMPVFDIIAPKKN